MKHLAPQKMLQKKQPIEDEFNNEALFDILNSKQADDLDNREFRRTSVWNADLRKSLGPAKRNTVYEEPKKVHHHSKIMNFLDSAKGIDSIFDICSL